MSYVERHEAAALLNSATILVVQQLEETFVEERHAQAGLRIPERRRGGWWTGVAHDQDVLASVPAGDGLRDA